KLRRERELRGIGLPEIAEATKISVRFLEALETDRLDVLPGGIFRRSFVKAYAEHVGLDPDRTVSELLAAEVDSGSPGTAAVNGRVVMNRVLSRGESQKLQATDEIVLSVGDAGALAVQINDRPALVLGRRGEVRRNVVITKDSLPALVEDSVPGRAHIG